MDRPAVRYEILVDEDTEPVEPVALTLVVPPPAYDQESHAASNTAPTCIGGVHPCKPPSYQVATELPTYEEAALQPKAQETEGPSQLASDPEQQVSGEENERFPGMVMGTDGMFVCTFLISLLFNWIGFLASLCVTNSIAGRCGALAGLGLSIVKWAAIAKQNHWMQQYITAGDTWVWWMLIVCGLFIFVRGCVQYIQVKYEWRQLTGQLGRRYLFLS